MIADLFELIPNKLKQQLLDTAVDVIASQAEAVGGQSMAHKIRQLRSDAAFTSAYETGLKKAVERFVNEYELEDEDLVAAMASNQELFADKQVQSALLAMVSQPGKYLNAEQDTLAQSFDSVLPERKNRERVDKAIAYLLRCLAEEMWHLPELQPIYTLQFARMTAEATREQVALQKAQLAALSSLGDGVRGALLQLTDSIANQKQLSPGNAGQQLPPPKVYHNLPQPDYGEFVGREKELAQIFKLLRPYPQSRHHLIVIDGIGGIGKSTLALEVAHQCLHVSQQTAVADEDEPTPYLSELRQILIDRFSEDELRTLCFDMALDYDMLPGQGKGGKAREFVTYLDRRRRLDELKESIRDARPDIEIGSTLAEKNATSLTAEQFDAIIWTSAKSNMLRAEGITSRRQIVRTLEDVYTSIAIALQQEEIIRAKPEEQGELLRRALSRKKTLLIVDNLETVDDESVLTFLRELPAPTKAIVTTRHRIDVAYPVRLLGMHLEDAKELILQECRKKDVALNENEIHQLFNRTGGTPMAIVWSIAQMSFGYGVSSVLFRLGEPTSDIARFSFEGALQQIRGKPAHKLLMALSLFGSYADREALGFITHLPELDRDEGLVILENLSLANRHQRRSKRDKHDEQHIFFQLLPLTRTYSKYELTKEADLEKKFRKRWLQYYEKLVAQKGSRYGDVPDVEDELINIYGVVDWCWEQKRFEDFIVLVLQLEFYLWVIGNWTEKNRYVVLGSQAAYQMKFQFIEANFSFLMGTMSSKQNDWKSALDFMHKAVKTYRLFLNNKIPEEESKMLQRIYISSAYVVKTPSYGLMMALGYLGKIQTHSGAYEDARTTLIEALTLAENQDKRGLARIMRRLAEVDLIEGDLSSAESRLLDAKNIRERLTTQASSGLAKTYRLLGRVYLLKRQFEESDKHLSHGLNLAEATKSQQSIAEVKQQLAELRYENGQTEQAEMLLKDALEIYVQLKMKSELMQCKDLLARINENPD